MAAVVEDFSGILRLVKRTVITWESSVNTRSDWDQLERAREAPVGAAPACN